MHVFIGRMLFAFLALFPILNPPAMAPVFLSLTSHVGDRDRNRLAALIGLYTFVFLTTLLVVGLSVVLAILGAWNFLHSKYGRNLMAIREQGMAAEAVGIDTARYKTLAFVVSAVYAGWSGALFAHYLTFLAPNMFNLDKSAELTITVVIGGLGSIAGSVIATIILTVLPELLRAASTYRMLFYGVAVVLIITVRPAGLMGYRELSFGWLRRWIQRWRAPKPTVEPELKS